MSQDNSINIGSVTAPANIGGQNNTMNVTYQTLLQDLTSKIDSDDSLPKEKKTFLRGLLEKVTETLVTGGSLEVLKDYLKS